MKTFEDLYKEEWHKRDWDEHGFDAYERAARRYATEVAKDALRRAAENAKTKMQWDTSGEHKYFIDKGSILETEIILP